jgi:outer membrane protein OmpU
MKTAMLGTTALVGVGLSAASAWAESPIQLSVGGFFREAYMVVLDDDDEFEPGDERSDDGFFNDAEIHFTGRTLLDNGLEVGARVELEGETNDDQVDEAWVWFAGGFGEFRIGSDDEALANSCIMPPGGTSNFSAFSPNQWGANAFSPVTNSACTGVDDRPDAQKIVYYSPIFYGFQLTASYTPEPGSETHTDGVGPHIGMPPKNLGDPDYDLSAYLTYSYQGSDWGLTWGGGGSFEVGRDQAFGTHFQEQDFYQTALVIDIDRFSIGGVFEYYHDIEDSWFEGFDFSFNHDAWVAGGGIAYAYNAWIFGAQYSYREDEFRQNILGNKSELETVQQRAVATVQYILGPGINIDGEIAYTWRDEDPENEFLFGNDDDYDGLEFGLGTAISF